jgi:LPXTG-site transpeptidase (sortase) family protein
MRTVISSVGTLLVLVGLVGALWLGWAALANDTPAVPVPVRTSTGQFVAGQPGLGAAARSGPLAAAQPELGTPAHPELVEGSAIVHLTIDSIGLDTDVAPAPLVEHNGVQTWSVPRLVAGHAEGTPGAGESGNAVVLGHVTSLTLGNVFERLNQVVPDARVSVFSLDRRFEYRVVEARQVDRADVSVLESNATASLTLITCSGIWLPTLWDYTDRFVVRADLVRSR